MGGRIAIARLFSRDFSEDRCVSNGGNNSAIEVWEIAQKRAGRVKFGRTGGAARVNFGRAEGSSSEELADRKSGDGQF